MYINHTFDKYVSQYRYVPATPTTEDSWEFTSTVPGRIRPASGGERYAGGKLSVIATHRVYTNVWEITEKDRLEIDGQMYEIILVNRPSESRHLEIDVLRID